MKIRLMHLDPKVTELIQSNNQNEDWKEAISKIIHDMKVDIQKLKDESQRRKSSEF